MLAKLILASLTRRAIGYLGVAGMTGLDNDLTQAVGGIAAAAAFAWSVVEKIREYRKTHPNEIKS